ncbi:MAG: glycoside hydrolase [Bacteroidales bacterium]|nr:glycoside hydrolase [Bacteroidales bacterium]
MKQITKSFISAITFFIVLCHVASGENKSFSLFLPSHSPESVLSDTIKYQIISRGEDAGEYQAFPDACRLKNGDIIAVFYAGDSHVTRSSEKYPNAGRICMVRSKDEGHTWTKPVVIYDDIIDNRDPHICQVSNGTVICSFFSYKQNPTQGIICVVRSDNNGKTWDKEAQVVSGAGSWFCSAPVREMPDSTYILPVYHQSNKEAWGGVFLSYNKGKTWENVISIGEKANLPLAAETDVVLLKDGSLFAALRAQGEVNMHYALSKDLGKTWSEVKNIGFRGHCPSFTRLKTGEILLVTRAFAKSGYTGLRISRDEAKTWEGPYLIDEKSGAYPATVELKDGSVLCIYYEEGKNSAIRALRFKVPEKMHGEQFAEPRRVETLTMD